MTAASFTSSLRPRPKLAVWKFASCDGCQLTLLDCEDELLAVAGAVEIAYFPEAVRSVDEGRYDLSLVEGSITTPHDAERIHDIRARSAAVITIGAIEGGATTIGQVCVDPVFASPCPPQSTRESGADDREDVGQVMRAARNHSRSGGRPRYSNNFPRHIHSADRVSQITVKPDLYAESRSQRNDEIPKIQKLTDGELPTGNRCQD